MSWKKISIMVVIYSLLLIATGSVTVRANPTHHVNPGESIQSAIESADTGDIVIVHAGTYHQFVVFDLDDSGITLRGDGAIMDGTGYPPMEVVAIVILSDATGITIEGFEFLNYRNAVVLEGSSGNIIQNNVLTGGFYDGIGLSNAHDNQILNNEVNDCTMDGIWLGPVVDEGGNPTTDGSNDNLILGNQISACHGGVILDMSHRNQVLNNKVSDSTGEGPDQGPGIFVGHTASYNIVSGNRISGCNDGINVGNAEHNQILENTITNSLTGIFLGLDFTGGSPEHNIVSGNRVSNCEAGIGLCNAHYNTIKGNKIEDMIDRGIFLGIDEEGNGSTYNTVEDNNVSSCGGAGIILRFAEDNTIESNKVKGSESAGIGAIFSVNNTIDGNKVSSSGFVDLFDNSGPPIQNTWEDNKYKTSNFS